MVLALISLIGINIYLITKIRASKKDYKNPVEYALELQSKYEATVDEKEKLDIKKQIAQLEQKHSRVKVINTLGQIDRLYDKNMYKNKR